MIDVYIFGFGLLVTILVGTGLGLMVAARNRADAQGLVGRRGTAGRES